ncbi:MAG: hypothetical protein ACRD07_12125 [Acidimicrobiales bacterium]
MVGYVAAAVFVIAVGILSNYLRRRDVGGYWDRDWRSSAARPGLPRFFDFRDDGVNQRADRHHGWA